MAEVESGGGEEEKRREEREGVSAKIFLDLGP